MTIFALAMFVVLTTGVNGDNCIRAIYDKEATGYAIDGTITGPYDYASELNCWNFDAVDKNFYVGILFELFHLDLKYEEVGLYFSGLEKYPYEYQSRDPALLVWTFNMTCMIPLRFLNISRSMFYSSAHEPIKMYLRSPTKLQKYWKTGILNMTVKYEVIPKGYPFLLNCTEATIFRDEPVGPCQMRVGIIFITLAARLFLTMLTILVPYAYQSRNGTPDERKERPRDVATDAENERVIESVPNVSPIDLQASISSDMPVPGLGEKRMEGYMIDCERTPHRAAGEEN